MCIRDSLRKSGVQSHPTHLGVGSTSGRANTSYSALQAGATDTKAPHSTRRWNTATTRENTTRGARPVGSHFGCNREDNLPPHSPVKAADHHIALAIDNEDSRDAHGSSNSPVSLPGFRSPPSARPAVYALVGWFQVCSFRRAPRIAIARA